jgi:hypothetical protein
MSKWYEICVEVRSDTPPPGEPEAAIKWILTPGNVIDGVFLTDEWLEEVEISVPGQVYLVEAPSGEA